MTFMPMMSLCKLHVSDIWTSYCSVQHCLSECTNTHTQSCRVSLFQQCVRALSDFTLSRYNTLQQTCQTVVMWSCSVASLGSVSCCGSNSQFLSISPDMTGTLSSAVSNVTTQLSTLGKSLPRWRPSGATRASAFYEKSDVCQEPQKE